MGLDKLLTPKPIEHYFDLTQGGEFNVSITQEEACVALKIHDYGIDSLSERERVALYKLIAKLKDQIWP